MAHRGFRGTPVPGRGVARAGWRRRLVLGAVRESVFELVERGEIGHDVKDVTVLTDEVRTHHLRGAEPRHRGEREDAGLVQPVQLLARPLRRQVALDETDTAGR